MPMIFEPVFFSDWTLIHIQYIMAEFVVNTKMIHLIGFGREQLGRSLYPKLISNRCPSLDNCPFWNFNHKICFEEYWAQLERLNSCDRSYNTVTSIDKNRIDSKAHKKHMYGLTPFDDKSLFFGKGLFAKQPSHPGEKSVGNIAVLGNNRVFCCIDYKRHSDIPVEIILQCLF
jgi:hypothetical protein